MLGHSSGIAAVHQLTHDAGPFRSVYLKWDKFTIRYRNFRLRRKDYGDEV
jgi:hypothetical protein